MYYVAGIDLHVNPKLILRLLCSNPLHNRVICDDITRLNATWHKNTLITLQLRSG